LQDNPVSSNKDLVALLQKHFPKLLLLNGKAVALFHVRIGDYVLVFVRFSFPDNNLIVSQFCLRPARPGHEWGKDSNS
jgi:hypothetical protein